MSLNNLDKISEKKKKAITIAVVSFAIAWLYSTLGIFWFIVLLLVGIVSIAAIAYYVISNNLHKVDLI